MEYGKQIAQQIFPQLINDEVVSNYDSSTNGLINYTKALKLDWHMKLINACVM